MTEAIRGCGLGFGYSKDAWVFRHLDCVVERGQILSILGPNGRGKTTLLKMLTGALTPVEGQLSIGGRIAYVPQLFQVEFDYTVLEMVLMGRVRHIGVFSQPSRLDEGKALAALSRFDMAAFAERRFQELSGGERQMVIFARALAGEADILVLDEPTSALDLRNQAMVLARLRRLSREDGLTVIFTTHQPHHALAVSDTTLLMLGGEEYAFGDSEGILTEGNLSALYGVALKRIAFELDGRMYKTFAPALLDAD